MADPNANMDESWMTVICSFIKVHWKAVFSIVWPFVSGIVFLLGFEAHVRCMYILMLMAGYWVTECIPLYMTGLMPIFLCPLLKVADSKSICNQYMNATNVLFIAGMMIAIAIEHCGLHLRIALRMMICLGCSPRKLHFGLSFVTMLLSMWLINAACCAMMCPIIMAILKELEAQGILNVYEPQDPENPTAEAPKPTKITMAFFFAAPFAANIGGCGTLVGTGTNISYKGLFEGTFPQGDKIDFLPWMGFNIPPMLLTTFLSWLSLQITCMGMFQPKSKEYEVCKRGSEKKDVIRDVIRSRLKELGPMSFKEQVVMVCFILILLGWLLRSPKLFTGWGDLYGKDYIKEAIYPYVFITLLFLIPTSCTWIEFCTKDRSKRPTKPSKGILTWDLFHKKVPWGMLFLLGGGFAISYAGKVSGMSTYLGQKMECFKVLPSFIVLAVCTFFASMFTELTSNVAICSLLVPVLFDMSRAMEVHPALYTFPTAVCCSQSFLMPTGTPTNAIALSYAGIPIVEMIKHGALTKLFAWIVIVVLFPTYGRCFYDTSEAPDWMFALSTVASEVVTTTTTAAAAEPVA